MKEELWAVFGDENIYSKYFDYIIDKDAEIFKGYDEYIALKINDGTILTEVQLQRISQLELLLYIRNNVKEDIIYQELTEKYKTILLHKP